MDSYTACVNDVLLNETDLCIGPFIGSAQRLSMATFTTSFFDSKQFNLYQQLKVHMTQLD